MARNVRLSKSLFELMTNAVLAGTRPAAFGDQVAMNKLQAAVEEYQAALDAWAGFDVESAPVVAAAPPPPPPSQTIASQPQAYNPFVERRLA